MYLRIIYCLPYIRLRQKEAVEFLKTFLLKTIRSFKIKILRQNIEHNSGGKDKHGDKSINSSLSVLPQK